MPLERAHIGRKQAEADRAPAVAVVDEVDQGSSQNLPEILR
jgi:hypothetical protein